MKKLIPFLLALIISLTGCSAQKTANDAVDAVFSEKTKNVVHKIVDGTFEVMQSEEMQDAKESLAETGKELWSDVKDAYTEYRSAMSVSTLVKSIE